MYNAGDFNTTETVIIPINSFSSDDPSASVTMTNLAAGDVEIHKNGSTTQRASDNGVTVTIDFDSITGNHIISIDLSDNSDAGFYSNGSRYLVRIEGVTVDGGTINAWVGGFSIGCTLRPTTAGNTLDVSSTGEVGLDFDNIKNATGAHTLTNITVPTVTTVGTCTTNSDMRGTDGSNTTVPDAAGTAASLHTTTNNKIDGLNNFDPANDDVANVTTVGTCTTNSDMRGTDNAATEAKQDIIDTNVDAILVDTGTTIPAQISGLNNLSSANVQTACDAAVAANTEVNEILLDTGTTLPNQIAALNNLSAADVWTYATRTLTSFGTLIANIWNYVTRTLTGGGDATAANQTTIITHLTDIKDNNGGADFDSNTDSLEAIRDRGDTAWITGGGAGGANIVTLTIHDDSGNNVVECAVEIWDAAGTTFYERQTTDSSGETEHNLDDGTYTVKIHKAGYIFSNETLIVSGNTTATYTGTAIVINPAPVATSCRVYEYAYQPGETPVTEVEAIARIVSLPYDYSGKLYSGVIVDGTYDSTTGIIYWDLPKSAEVEFKMPKFGVKYKRTIPNSSSARLSDISS